MPDSPDNSWPTISTPLTPGAAARPKQQITPTLPQPLIELSTIPPHTTSTTDVNLALAPPGFEILGELGRGGMGVVYHARQTKLNREVALKMILSGGHAGEQDRARFLAEAEAIAALNHPGIVQVYEFGTHNGQPYFALEYCSGGSLAKQLNGTPLPAKEAASLVQKLAYAMHAAHEKGIVHRDLKPANILISDCGFRIADSEDRKQQSNETFQSEIRNLQSAIKITDFGLAKKVESGRDLTRTGAIMGTPSYMAPEQARGEGKQIGPATDVYALGAILYELLTGRPPFNEATPIDTVLRVIDDDPVSIRQLQRKTPIDLETICHKALHKDPERRYSSAKELARDLGRWLSGEPIHARPAGRTEKTIKWVKRRPATAALIAVTFLAGLALLGGGLYYNAELVARESRLWTIASELDIERDSLATANRSLDAEREKVRRNLARSNLILADNNWKSNDALGTIKALAAVPEDLRHWDWGYLQRRALGGYMTLWGHTGEVTSVVFSPDDTRLASASYDRTVRLWDAKTGAVMQTLTGHTGAVTSVAFSPDGASLASGSFDKTVRLWDAKTGVLVQMLSGHTGEVTSVAFSPDGARLASGSYDTTVRLWDAKTGDLVLTLTGHTGAVTSLAFSPDGARLASGGTDSGVDSRVRLWDAKSGTLLQTLTGHPRGSVTVAFSPDGARIASGSADSTVRLWDAKTGAMVQTLTGHSAEVSSVAFSPDGALLASGGFASTANLLDAKTGAALQVLPGHTGEVKCVAFSPDGARLASGGTDNEVRVWDAKRRATTQTLTGHTSRVMSVAFSPDGARLATGSYGKAVKIWDAKTGAVLHSLIRHDGPVMSVAFSPDGARLVSGSFDSTVRLWDAKTGALMQTLTGHTGEVMGVAFSPDGARIASGSADSTVRLWDAKTGAMVQTLTGHSAEVSSVAFSPDGALLASGSEDNTVRLWRAENGAAAQTLSGHTGRVTSVAFSPDGARLASGSWDKKVRIWDARTGAVVHTLPFDTDMVTSVGFSPDGARLASGSYLWKTVKVWDATNGILVQTLTGFALPDINITYNRDVTRVTSVAFSPDGELLASGEDKTVCMWGAKSKATVKILASDNSWILSVSFSPDGSLLATSQDKTVRLWDAKTGAIVQTMTGHTVPVTRVSFSPDGSRLASQDHKHLVKVWETATGKETVDPRSKEWLETTTSSPSNPDGQNYAIPQSDGTILLVKPLPPDECELGYRAYFARPDPDWHWQQAQKFEKDQSWFAAAFHCEQVLKHRPEDAAAKKLLDTAREYLKTP